MARKSTQTTSPKAVARTTRAVAPKPPLRKIYAAQIKDLGKLRNAAAEARARAQGDEIRRTGAANILEPSQIASGKKWTPAAVLKETLGTAAVVGFERSVALTAKQIRAFKDNIAAVQRNFRGGITAQQTLDFAAKIDKERARRQIKVSIPISAQGGRVKFLTSASLLYKETRHHVTVEFMGYEAAVAGAQGSPTHMARWLRQEPLKFDCDCGRHAFFYRYITTIGQFNAGRPETGYPKVTNAQLTGVCCKHVVRTMAEITGGAGVVNFLAKLIEKGRKARRPSDVKKVQNKITQREMEEQAAKMFKRARAIHTTHDMTLAQERKALRDAAKAAPLPARAAGANRSLQKMIEKDVDAAVKAIAAAHQINPAMLAKFIAQQKGKK